jgi:serine/threonine protein kinase
VTILGFGLAREQPLAEDGPGVTRAVTSAGTVLGTVAYMSPEQARGALADARSDQFSFGLVLYELASGRQAFARDSAVQTLTAIIEATFRALPVPLPCGTDGVAARRRATRRRAVRVPAITRRADRKQPVAAPADFLAKRRVHDVGAAARFDWTRRSNRGTRATTDSVAVGASRWSPRVWRHQLQALPSFAARTQRTRRPPEHSNPGGRWTLTRLWTHRSRPQPLGNLAGEREIPTSVYSPSSLLCFKTRSRPNRDWSRFTRFQTTVDTPAR